MIAATPNPANVDHSLGALDEGAVPSMIVHHEMMRCHTIPKCIYTLHISGLLWAAKPSLLHLEPNRHDNAHFETTDPNTRSAAVQ